MKKYLLAMKLQWQSIAEYRIDFIISATKYSVMVTLMALVWLAVDSSTTNPVMTRSETINYFVISAIIYSLSNFHTWYIEEDIKLGGLSKYLVKPINTSNYYLSIELANVIAETLFKILVMVPTIYILGYTFSVTLDHMLLFIAYLPLVFYFSFNVLVGTSYLAFWLSDVFAIRWSLMIVVRFLAGILVPITFFPQWYQEISWLLPFQHLAFTPIQVVMGKYSISTGIEGLLILAFWTLLAVWCRNTIWRKGTCSYEGAGI